MSSINSGKPEKQIILSFTTVINNNRLAVIMAKVKTYDWSRFPTAAGWSSGVGMTNLRWLADYWCTLFDCNKIESRPNKLPQ